MSRRYALCFMIFVLLLSGCARGPDVKDPYESFNRKIFALNQRFDDYLLKPATITYDRLLPWPVRSGINHFFDNLTEVQTIINGFLQVKPRTVIVSSWRFAINSTVGIGGMIDVAKHMGLEKHYEDFGLTLAHYGLTDSPYFVRPLVGPSTFRDTFGNLVDSYLWGPFAFYTPYYYRQIAPSVYALSIRSGLLANEGMLNMPALDPYVFQRDAYLQYRDFMIHKTKPTTKQDEDLLADDEDDVPAK